MIVFKILILQLFWYLAVTQGHENQKFFLGAAVLIVLLNYSFFKPKVAFGHYAFCIIFFATYGMLQEYSFELLGLVSYNQDGPPLWLNSLYIVFLAYYGDVFNYLSKRPLWTLIIIGALGGVSTYYGGVKLSPIVVLNPMYYFAVALGWGVFFPLSFKIFYEGYMWNKLLDASIYFSFDKSGFLRHQKEFSNSFHFKENAHALVTGGTSGIGFAAALNLAGQGVKVRVTGRDLNKGQQAANKHKFIHFSQMDMSRWQEISQLVESLEELDYLVLNAGGMPNSFQQNDQGVEFQFASQLFGHYYLLKELRERGKLKKGARVVWVTSGGMYLSRLDLTTITTLEGEYNKVKTYANVKRAQVTLLPYLNAEFPEQLVVCMHPGWAKTPGVTEAIPEFDKKMEGRLRTAEQAADTILWLLSENSCVESGKLYFDRRKVKSHFFWFTRKSDEKLSELISLIEKLKPTRS